MITFLARRIGSMLVVIMGITVVAFLLIRLIPVDPAEAYLNLSKVPITQAALDAARMELGLDRPLFEQYAQWISHAVRFDFGTSFISKKPVLTELEERFGVTAQLGLVSLVLILLLSVPAGIWSAVRKNGWFDRITRISIFAIASMPSFWLAFILVYWLGFKWGLLPLMGRGTLAHMVLPSLTLALIYSTYYIQLIRTSMLEHMEQPHVWYARSRGVRESLIIIRHVGKSTLLPIVTSLGITMGHLLGGTVIVENVFAIPGIGRYLIESMMNRDYAVVQCFVLVIGVFFVVINFLSDIVCAIVDPRIREKGE